MKVKVGNTIFDGALEPVMIILNDLDRQNIVNMAEGATCYASFPEDSDKDEMAAWMADTSWWHDPPYLKIAELRVAEGKIKVLRATILALRRGAV